MTRTIEQQINEANDKLNRLKAKKKRQEARQLIVLGSSLLAVAKLNRDNANMMLALLKQAKMRDAEMRDLEPVMKELESMQ